MRNNPFIIEQVVTPEHLINRTEELQTVQQTLTQGGKLFLIAPRRFGKTSILVSSATRLRENGYSVIYLNLQTLTSMEQIINDILTQAASFTSNVKKAAEQMRQIFTRFNPHFTYDPNTNLPTVSLGIKSPAQAEQPALLIEALRQLETLAGKQKAPIGVIFDEFQELLYLGGADIEKQLRGEMQMHQRVGYVIAGSETALLTEMISNPNRPFYKLGFPLFLKTLPTDEVAAYITQSFRQIKCPISTEAINEILRAAQNVPHAIQLICHKLWEYALLNGLKKVEPQEVQATIHTLLSMYNPVYVGIWLNLVPNQRRILQLIAGGTTTQLLSQASVRQANLSPGIMQKSLQSLERTQILRKEMDSLTVNYVFLDPLFALWIKDNAVGTS